MTHFIWKIVLTHVFRGVYYVSLKYQPPSLTLNMSCLGLQKGRNKNKGKKY